ncbi:MAG: nucleoside triphosphate pyrophosphatase [Pseudanabaenaceae cyanobacterium]
MSSVNPQPPETTAINAITLILASASPARRAILRQIGLEPQVQVSHFDEDQIQVTDPAPLVLTLAQCKADAVAKSLVAQSLRDQNDTTTLILGCDSVMYLNGEIYGKPESPAVAVATWQKMRQHYGEIYTGHCLIDLKQQRTITRYRSSKVFFGNPTDVELENYISTGEPLCCAGCFTLEGLGGLFIDKLEGCHTNVLGLSLPLFREMLGELGYRVALGRQGSQIVR